LKKITVLSTGCCDSLFQTENEHISAREDAELYELEQISDLEKVYSYGIMELPAMLVEDETLIVGERSHGEVMQEIDKLLAKPETV
jgi:hypothetical protein